MYDIIYTFAMTLAFYLKTCGVAPMTETNCLPFEKGRHIIFPNQAIWVFRQRHWMENPEICQGIPSVS